MQQRAKSIAACAKLLHDRDGPRHPCPLQHRALPCSLIENPVGTILVSATTFAHKCQRGAVLRVDILEQYVIIHPYLVTLTFWVPFRPLRAPVDVRYLSVLVLCQGRSTMLEYKRHTPTMVYIVTL